jgi:hypothetical protein
MNIGDIISQPLSIGFAIFAVVLVVMSRFVPALRAMQVFLITYAWIGLSFFVGSDGFAAIWLMGFIVWLFWLWECLSVETKATIETSSMLNSLDDQKSAEKKKSLDVLLSEKTSAWVPGSDALFWVISVPLFAFWIGLWGLSYMGDDDNTWSAWLAVLLVAYAAWLTTWRISCVMPFVQGSNEGGADFVPVPVN